MAEDLLLIGFGGHAKSVIDAIEGEGRFRIAGYTELEDKGSYRGYRRLGGDESLARLFEEGLRYAFVCVGYLGEGRIRDRLCQQAEAIGFTLPVIVDRSAAIASDVQIGAGTFVGKRAVINSDSRIGKMCIVNTGAIVEHENIVGDYSHIAVGAHLCGNVRVGGHSLIGVGATVLQGCGIGNETIIGAGAVVISDMPDSVKAMGVPAEIVQ